ncbi:hypothetical protein PUN28_005528 [Cardiocondyla obscurior]|uniref:Uncharacterized protein n=1 Tax=Cardiocondyla obscurior TaxID=286306 RepID=A0AAW2GLE0_9HYME
MSDSVFAETSAFSCNYAVICARWGPPPPAPDRPSASPYIFDVSQYPFRSTSRQSPGDRERPRAAARVTAIFHNPSRLNCGHFEMTSSLDLSLSFIIVRYCLWRETLNGPSQRQFDTRGSLHRGNEEISSRRRTLRFLKSVESGKSRGNQGHTFESACSKNSPARSKSSLITARTITKSRK